MLLMIAQNPWVKEPQALVDLLKNSSQIRMTAISNDVNKSEDTLDKQGFSALKRRLSNSSKKILVK
jgi:hypothetical protein